MSFPVLLKRFQLSSIFSAGKPINIRLSGSDISKLQAAAVPNHNQTTNGVEDISDSFRIGKREII